ncbi:hypothetical protein BDV30DRAFT_240866 [Aspergillus minisclerotigenes]|uniref:Uncharacterized protein n=1 Tax=Aspergillus minisclerotigenes TaxID=656917 RepID=A0A5N6IYQ7_9EURO|nr:hypothetical protein BDV30DRAFT_240866 [Aspergillus minisclerotigenes]
MLSTLVQSVEQKLNLRAYGGTIEDVKSLKSSTLDTPLEELRTRFNEDGVLWVKGLLNRDLVNKRRRDYLEFVNQGSGMLSPAPIRKKVSSLGATGENLFFLVVPVLH